MRIALKSAITLIIIFSLISCSRDANLKEQIFSTDNITDIAAKISKSADMTQEDIDLLTNSLSRFALERDSIVGKTVAQLIESQRQFDRKSSIAGLTTASARLAMVINLAIKYYGIQPKVEDGIDKDILYFEIQNKAQRDIKKIEGFLQFHDAENNLVKKYPVSILFNIKANTTEKFSQPFNHDAKNPRDEFMRKEKNVVVLWDPIMVEYSDGKIISLKSLNR